LGSSHSARAHTRHGCVLPAKEYTGNRGKELPDSHSKKGRQKRASARVRMFGQREVRADDGAGEGMRRGKRASSKPERGVRKRGLPLRQPSAFAKIRCVRT